MSTKASRSSAQLMLMPAVVVLLIWMLVPLCMTLYYSFQQYVLTAPSNRPWVGFDNYYWFFTDIRFYQSVFNTLFLVGGVLIITVFGGIGFALLLDRPMFGQGFIRILVIAPFFVMPTVSAVVWKNMFMNPTNGFFAKIFESVGLVPIEFLQSYALESITFMVAWQWLPFATLILLTAMQSLDQEQLEAAEMDGANWGNRFWYMILPHLSRAITVVILIQTIFLLSIFAEIFVTTGGGSATTLTYLVFQYATGSSDVGVASAGGVFAIILANIVAIFLMRAIGKNLDA